MMTYIYKALLLAVTLVALHSCYEDKGNYSYGEINEVYIDTVGVDMIFALDQFDTLSIIPDISFTLKDVDESELEFKWVMYSDAWSKDESYAEELSTEKNLKVQITQEPDDDAYAVVLYVTNKQNNTVSQVKYNVSILPSVVSGLMVLHTDGNGQSDLDYIATTNAVPTLDKQKWLHNVYSAMNGSKIIGEPDFVSTVRVNRSVIDYVYVVTDQQFLQLSGTNFELQHQDLELYKQDQEFVIPQYVGHGPDCHYVTLMINNGQVQNINNQASQAWDVQFSRPLSPSSNLGGELDLAPYVYFSDNCSATTVGQAGVMYDQLNKRFVRLEFSFWEEASIIGFPDQTSIKFDVNNIGKDLIFFEKGYRGHGFAVFTDGTSRELYRADFNKTNPLYDENGEPYENEAVHNLAVNSYDLSALPEIYDAEFYACGPLGNFFLYASDRNIYTYSYAASKKVATLINDAFPDGEEITSMKIYNTDWFYPLDDVNATLLYVATWNGSEGKLYEFKINRASGRLNNKEEIDGIVNPNAPTNVFTGFGKIVDMSVKLEGLD
ncbi:PKD-like family lipoprotein [Plebeiibacterium marinum]|uniref:PKD-like family lipoprotein n=1 Tax=Plebeiibacterium marinum TaxID=2992111 RepID=A0AAE3SM31_9BACT|nr:PKD-like family lipoprotein [Plebeiobacterium marinum]MCW3807130.1 PKD-like family lipoprotein [Plebeiobacterium marinum]